ncbi:MAG: hypothetical protein ACP59X_06635 [Solidesulfovibrio sp. DCME]|uniref:hypothetical protein n=1 Tax=Solidesulfovibrio sp. DCME TaxID=3447380 RepID=UPI003D0F4B43
MGGLFPRGSGPLSFCGPVPHLSPRQDDKRLELLKDGESPFLKWRSIAFVCVRGLLAAAEVRSALFSRPGCLSGQSAMGGAGVDPAGGYGAWQKLRIVNFEMGAGTPFGQAVKVANS